MLIVQSRSRRTPVTAMLIAAVVIVTAFVAWLATSGPDGPEFPIGDPPAPGVRPAAPATTAMRPVLPGVPADGPAATPPEDPARVFDLGFAGGLLIDASTVSALDRLQAGLGDNPTPEALARLEQQLREGLPREDADKAIRLFNGYRAYSHEMRTEVMALGVPQTREAADALLARMTAVQHRHFDAASADAMFGDQNRLSKVVLDASLVQNDPGLSDAQKKTRLDALRYTLPENQRHVVPDLPPQSASAPQ